MTCRAENSWVKTHKFCKRVNWAWEEPISGNGPSWVGPACVECCALEWVQKRKAELMKNDTSPYLHAQIGSSCRTHQARYVREVLWYEGWGSGGVRALNDSITTPNVLFGENRVVTNTFNFAFPPSSDLIFKHTLLLLLKQNFNSVKSIGLWNFGSSLFLSVNNGSCNTE